VDPARKAELNRALAEIDRARKELSNAQAKVGSESRSAAREAAEAAHEAAVDVAQSTIESATEARETIEEARREALDKLRDKGIDTTATTKSFDDLIRSAREREHAAREALKAIRKLRDTNVNVKLDLGKGFKVDIDTKDPATPDAKAAVAIDSAKKNTVIPVPPKTPVPQISSAGPKVPAIAAPTVGPGGNMVGINELGIHLPPIAPLAPLAPEFRDDIRAKVAGDVWRIGVGSALILTFIPLFIMLLIAKYYIGRSRRALALADKKTEEAEISNVNRQVTEARLQALQAQVEPHFLYNTLANVQALTEVDPPAANQMVGHLIQYLRASLPKMRETSSTVGQEVERVRAYLNILKMRMGPRLEFGIVVPEDLMTAPFPPMMLPSLVENAIKHGLEPQREGGRIDVIVARMFTADGDRIRLQVKDTGRGLSDAPIQAGGGVGLSNLRERLTALYGDQAKFTIESNDPKGVVATIELPATLAAQQAASPNMSSRGSGASVVAQPPRTGWGRAWGAAAKTHSVWARILSVVFFTFMALLTVLLVVGLIALYTGWLPVHMGASRVGGLEGMALGSVGLLIGFGAAALVVAIVVAVIYGLGFLAAGLLIVIPVIILISMVPALSPFAVVGFAIYWFWWRKRDQNKQPIIRDAAGK
ncbi:MAG: histidine kinase, partial [Burkholderiales bacterium]|nr:histidine kinase [Burkholderiales bacterium]